MRDTTQFIVPGLGALALLSVFLLGTTFNPAYLVLLGLLGAAAVGTFFMPTAVQVEVRIAISALGLLVLVFMFSSLGFWLALLSFGTIGALQIRHRSALQMPPQTFEWLKTLRAHPSGGGAESAAALSGTGDEAAPSRAWVMKVFGKGGIGGWGASALSIIILLTAVMPWFGLSAPWMDDTSFSGWELVRELNAEDGGSPIPYAIAGALGALALLAAASVVLPRWAPAVAGVAGLAVMIFTFIYTSAVFGLDDIPEGSGAEANFGVGFWLTSLAFVLIAGLQLLPRPNRSSR